eukprot:TRINITY_DN13374_c0_g1_i1.p1 TRINITY_DN13374_c0_g1~~TRINITY_DN13374_c0_g1_i1.p1  ORF type:complete len:586 (+),score=102.38 TRINITY_DN13374_c0_g1_i1:232-1989(+)
MFAPNVTTEGRRASKRRNSTKDSQALAAAAAAAANGTVGTTGTAGAPGTTGQWPQSAGAGVHGAQQQPPQVTSGSPPLTFEPWFKHSGGNLVKVAFYQGESPLGLVMDWSMPFPVIAGVLDRHPAAMRPELGLGLVLIAINEIPLPGLQRTRRSEVESLLAQRPLRLVFENAAPLRLQGPGGEVALLPWQNMGPSEAVAAEIQAKSQSSLLRSSRRLSMSMYSASNAGSSPRGGPGLMSGRSRSSFSLAGGSDQGESPTALRSPSGYGSPSGLGSVSCQRPLRGLTSWSSTGGGGGLGGRSNDSSWLGMMSPTGSYCSGGGSTGSLLPPVAGRSKPRRRRPDQCYMHTLRPMGLEDDRASCGPGPTWKWNMDHFDGDPCCMTDMKLARAVRDCYEVGFHGHKKTRPGQLHILLNKGAPIRPALVVLTETEPIWCDLCGEDVASVQKPGLFWYCRKCKRNGNRYDLCVACHAVEMLQGEGKHAGSGPHPHFLRCDHSKLVRYQDLRVAYPTAPQLRRIYCDHCGCVVRFRGEEFCGQADVIFVCPTCPTAHGLRFEICEKCAYHLRDRGHGIKHMLLEAGSSRAQN